MSQESVAILGAGSWGTALSVHLARIGHDVRLWARDPGLVDQIVQHRVNPRYLRDAEMPPAVRPTASLGDALSGAAFVVLTVPSHGLRGVIRTARPLIAPGVTLVSAVKGLELGSMARMSEVVAGETGGAWPIVVLSGPSFASEVARGLPTAVLAASSDPAAAAGVLERFRGPALRLYASDDVVGVEVGGALKNVIAIAAGVVDGLDLGHNAMAALITRGLAEITRLACAEGGRRETLAGLSGLGDLVLTCTGDLSRNRHVGVELGRGRRLDDILTDLGMVAEGVRTTAAALALGAKHNIELPIAARMASVFEGRASPREAADALMLRPQRRESET
ncbi:MAG: NAD(P)-dependent glycerol-3-phosphate dehydrogenase [Acidobacteria bacterium]|nr:NAD(P)-dependent glycerol-3-phosphate dehydrogenase [Acidobacteriota bacterium]MCA1649479.1 NAD(P)-dependent glycerol-3-phosphate dehydrogenase [Acidobacteriota bacterium]